MSSLLGIDLGTSSVKVLLMTAAGQVFGRASASYPVHRPRPAWAEQAPGDWWRAMVEAVHAALAQSERPSPPVAAIGLSGQMHGTVLLDRTGQTLHPAIIWSDQRSRRQVKEITTTIGPERLVELTGSPVCTGFQAATARWIQQNRPDLWRRTHTILLPKDAIRYRLTGELCTDPSDGSGTSLLDVRRRDWSPQVLAAAGIEPAQLPPVRPSGSVTGHLDHTAAEELGLPPGIPVVTGAGDTPCSLLGAGVSDGSTLLVTLGSGGQVAIPTTDVRPDPAGRIHTFCSALAPGAGRAAWYHMAATLSAAKSLDWLRRLLDLSGSTTHEQMSAWAAEAPAGAEGLLFLPYLEGERSPLMDPQARGMFLGLTARHDRRHVTRAVMEGVALACYHGYRVLAALGARPERIVMAGGGAQSAVWRQIVADVFDLPLERLAVQEQSATGAVLLAGEGIGLFDPASAGQAWATYGPPVEPDRERHTLYEELLALLRDAYTKHRDDFCRLDALADQDATGQHPSSQPIAADP